ncbi:MAG: class I SAM-dependent methyltransferase [Myxococcus sp.]|nr:class I SAM-dependent methyltransferase [Myxococcus sp.]
MDQVVYQELASLDENDWWWFLGRRAIIRETLERHLRPRAARRVLDAGCGSGGNLPMLRRFGAVTGLEPSPIAVEAARRRCGDAVRVVQGTIPEGLPQEAFELIGLFDVLEHLAEPVPALSAIRERLTPDGQLVITVPAFQFLWSKHDEINHHFRRYTLPLLAAELASAGFQVDFSTYYNITLFPPIAAVRLLRKLLPGNESDNEGSLTGGLANAILSRTFAAERHLVSRVRFPFGVSLLVMASRR